MNDGNSPDLATRTALARMSGILDAMANDMTTVSKVVSDLTSDTALSMSAEQISHLQRIDHICQSLQDLSVVSRSLAIGQTAQTDTIGQLKLAETRAILTSDHTEKDQPTSGTVDLF
ncbi:hypothetical protein [uncultured Tateyamaria sp.]|uniref:hypothetical protein n=1 Tax=uncultured Tateyamaria sp. TaxID=455651 RepID=UPI00261D4E50|nr:hypothetical protein [uncultured Tateyamaria sp.]